MVAQVVPTTAAEGAGISRGPATELSRTEASPSPRSSRPSNLNLSPHPPDQPDERHAHFNDYPLEATISPLHHLPGEPLDEEEEQSRRKGRTIAGEEGQHFDDARKAGGSGKGGGPVSVVDIEHVPVDDDPRQWSEKKKSLVLAMVSFASLAPTLAANIYAPAFNQLKVELNATEGQLSASIAVFILFQGGWPIFWSSIAEVTGRKIVYLTSFAFTIVGTIVASRAQSMVLLILMRLVQAFGSGAVLSIGAGSLADMYERHERGTKMGIYYATPLIGPSLGPVIGGILTDVSSWRATFYLLAAFAGASFTAFIFFPDSWRRERSQLYQVAAQRAIKRALVKQEHDERKRLRKLEKGLRSGDVTPGTTVPPTPKAGTSGVGTPQEVEIDAKDRIAADQDPEKTAVPTPISASTIITPQPNSANHIKIDVDLEKKDITLQSEKRPISQRLPWSKRKPVAVEEEHEKVKLTLADVNPGPAMWQIVKKPNNVLAILSSGLLFGAQYTISFTAAVTFAEPPYNYSPLKVGLFLLSFGGGNVLGSILGGRYSDYILQRLKKKNGGQGEPEMRLKSALGAGPVMVASFLVYAWTADQKTNVAGPAVALVFGGFTIMAIYASTLAYIVDANPGRSSSAISCNSMARGGTACIFSFIALPIRNAIGDGGLYTLISALLVVSCLGFFVVIKKGKKWRDPEWSFRGRKEAPSEA